MSSSVTKVALGALAISAATQLALRTESAPSFPRHDLSQVQFAHAPRTVWDSVYTEEQAMRGRALYGRLCARCHQAAMTGADEVPALVGGSFLSAWNSLTLDILCDRIKSSMPSDNPGSLSRQQVADVVAYVLRFNNFPAGNNELARETEFQREIRIVATKR
jgi:mono/diheme cytochrome c family protein